MRKKKNAFTLIELLAVIVILAVILVISIPRILDVIEESKVNTFKSTAQLIADSAEKKYVTNKLNNIDEVITCENVTKLSKEDYISCTIIFDLEGKATVSITGSGKFDGLVIKNATKNNAIVTELVETDSKYFSYEVQIDGLTDDKSKIYDVTVTDQSKCESYLISEFTSLSQEQATTLCSGNSLDGVTLQQVVLNGGIPSTDYEEAGLKVDVYNKIYDITVTDQSKCESYLVSKFSAPQEIATTACNGGVINGEGVTLADVVKAGDIPSLSYDLAGLKVTSKVYDKGTIIITGYNIEGGLDVVIPSEIDGKKVTAIGASAFESKGITSVIIPNTITSIGERAFRYNKLTSVIIPSSVTSIGYSAFYISNSKIINNTNIADVDIWKRITGGACGPSIKMENNIIYLGKLKNC